MSPSSVIGVDLGGTKIRIARYDLKTWEMQAAEEQMTHANQEFPHVMDDMVKLVEQLCARETLGVGFGLPGLILQPSGVIHRMPNIPGGENVPFRMEMQKRLKLPITVENDVNCFTFAEALHGAGKGKRVVVGIAMGTGVGGGIVIDGKLYHGEHGFAAEVGHMLLRPGEPPYKTEDRRGEVEQFLSGSAMGKRCSEAKRPEEYLQGEVCTFLQPTIFREVAWLCVNLIHLLDPSIIVFAGSAGRALTPHLENIRAEIAQWILPGTPLPPLAVAALKDAATRGAALLVAQAHQLSSLRF